MNSMANTAAERFVELTESGPGKVLGDMFLYALTHRVKEQAIPSFPDGLLPVQRRQIMAMQDLRVFHDSKYVKAQKVVADTMGNYHPAGDSYDALVNQSQVWNVQLPMTDPVGNWGPIDSGKAADQRYTEIRLSRAAEEILLADMPSQRQSADDVPHGIVPQRKTYDELRLEEMYFPARVPMMLINGGTGIAIAVAQSWLQLNTRDVLRETKRYIQTGEFDVNNLAIGYPVQPTVVSTREHVNASLNSGRGSVRFAGTWVNEGGKVVFTSTPPGVLLNDIGDAVNAFMEKPTGAGLIKRYENDSPEGKVRLVFTLQPGIEPDEAAPLIMKFCKLIDTTSVVQYALVDGRPKQLGLPQFIQLWVDERQQQIQRIASRNLAGLRLEERRISILEFLRDHLTEQQYSADPVIYILKSSEDRDEMLSRLRAIPAAAVLDLDQIDLDYILQLNLRSISRLSDDELTKRRDRINKSIAHNTALVEQVSLRMAEMDRQITDIEAMLDVIGHPDYRAPMAGEVYAEVASGVLAKARPKADTLRQVIDLPDPEGQDVIVTTEQGFILKLSTRSVTTDKRRPAALNAGDRITHATFHNKANLVILDDHGNISVIKKAALKYNEQYRYTVLNQQFGTKINGTPTVLTPNPETAEKMVVRYGTTIKVMDVDTEVYSTRAIVKAPAKITDVTACQHSIIVSNGLEKPLKVSIDKLEPVSRSRTGRLPQTKYTGRSGLILNKAMVHTDGKEIWRVNY